MRLTAAGTAKWPARALAFVAILVMCGSLAAPAQAQWPQGALVPAAPTLSLGHKGTDMFYLAPGAGPSDRWAVANTFNGSNFSVAVSGFETNGTFRFFTSLSGLLAATTPAQSPMKYDPNVIGMPFAPDAGGGGFYFYSAVSVPGSTSRGGLYALRLRADGTAFTTSVRIDSSHTSQGQPLACAVTTADSGAWCVWPDAQTRIARLIRVDRNAAPVAPFKMGGWSIPGMRAATNSNGPHAMLDDAGALLVATADSVIRVQRILSDTTIAAGWPATGVRLAGSPAFTPIFPYHPIIRGDANSAYVLFTDLGTNPAQLYVQRFLTSGVRDPLWPANGIPVSNTGVKAQSVTGFADGQGGITITWLADTLLCAMHLNADGTPTSGYAGGPRVLAAPPKPITAWSDFNAFPTLAGAATCAGRDDGLFVCYVDAQHVVHSRWYDGNGDPSPSAALFEVTSPDVNVPAIPGSPWVIANAAESDGQGGAYVSLQRPTTDGSLQLYAVAAHITQTSVLDSPTPRAPARLALSAGPNPSRGTLTLRLALPRAAAAHVALYDIGGRVRFSRDISGAGEHVVALNEAGVLEPGVYLARATQGDASANTRLVVVR